MSDAPGSIGTCALKVPSALSVAVTPLTTTDLSATPSGLGFAVPATMSLPALPWMVERDGEVTFNTGGSGSAPGASVHAENARRDATVRRLRMACRDLQQGPSQL